MKPLAEWTGQELRDALLYPETTGHDGCDDRYFVLMEVVSRERQAMKERCEAVIASLAKKYADAAASLPDPGVDEYGERLEGPAWTPNMDGTWSGLQMAEHAIREMK